MEEIITDRLILREFRGSDHEDVYEYLSQLRDDEFEGYPNITFESAKEHLQYRIASGEFYAVELKKSGKVIGNLFYGNRDHETKEVGYIINKDYRRQGYGTEALSAVIENAFSEGVHRVFAECDARNIPSWRLLEKVGMRREGRLKQNISSRKDEGGDPIRKDTYIYALTEADRGRSRK